MNQQFFNNNSCNVKDAKLQSVKWWCTPLFPDISESKKLINLWTNNQQIDWSWLLAAAKTYTAATTFTCLAEHDDKIFITFWTYKNTFFRAAATLIID